MTDCLHSYNNYSILSFVSRILPQINHDMKNWRRNLFFHSGLQSILGLRWNPVKMAREKSLPFDFLY